MIDTRKVGVIGAGFVGQAVVRGFIDHVADVRAYDVDPLKTTHSLEEVLECEFIFVCLPTPMEDVEGGRGDISILENFFDSVPKDSKSIFIIKSTVPVGTTRYLADKTQLAIVHNPEFLTERAAVTDFITGTRQIVGGNVPHAVNEVGGLLKKRFPMCPVFLMKPEESELVKYIANGFLATKVMFFNEIKMLSDKMGLQWDLILDGVLSDGRIAKSHTGVPGHDGDGGFGGKCFPKDINALIATMEDHEIEPLQLKATWEQNKRIRKNWDWAKIKGAVKEK